MVYESRLKLDSSANDTQVFSFGCLPKGSTKATTARLIVLLHVLNVP